VAQPAALDTFLGFEIGEERRYIVGPQEALRDGERITWSVRLERVVNEDGRDIGVFELTHQTTRYGMSTSGSMLVHWNYVGEARINEYGFPEAVRFSFYEEHNGESQWRGDTLSAIARRYGVKLNDLYAANNLRSSLLRINQTLTIPTRPTSGLPTARRTVAPASQAAASDAMIPDKAARVLR